MFVPLTKAACLPLNVVQSVLVRCPLTLEVAAGIEIAGVFPPLETIGDVPVTLVTVPTEIEPPSAVELPLMVIALFVSDELPILDKVLFAPEMVLLVKVCVSVVPKTVPEGAVLVAQVSKSASHA